MTLPNKREENKHHGIQMCTDLKKKKTSVTKTFSHLEGYILKM